MVLPAALLVVLSLSVASVLAACGGGDKAAASPELTGVVWEWQGSQYSNDTKATPDDPSMYTIEFVDDGTVNIRSDCNQVGGTYQRGDDGTLSLELGRSTKVLCEPGSLADAYQRDLEGAAIDFFDDSSDLLIDIKFDSGTMRFAPAA